VTVTKKFLRRYTSLPVVIRMLKTGKITFLNPATWDDKNDSYFMGLYKEARRLRSLLALCFSQETETYHHWRVFADGSSGVCISFNKPELIKAVKGHSGVTVREVSYLRLNNLESETRKADDLPFIKRAPFEPESEFRFIYESKKDVCDFLDVDIPLSCIDRIYLSPWMPEAVADSVKEVLNLVPTSTKFKITRSTLIQNDTWAKYGRKIVSAYKK
jgi:hypothetical protein